jgi:hypothetical protein
VAAHVAGAFIACCNAAATIEACIEGVAARTSRPIAL